MWGIIASQETNISLDDESRRYPLLMLEWLAALPERATSLRER